MNKPDNSLIREVVDQYIQEKQITQVLFPGKVISNDDPRKLGRLRIEIEGMVESAINAAKPEYREWDVDDPKLFLPLLPYTINPIPLKDEYVNVIYYDKNYKFKNQFYISNVLTDVRNIKKENYQNAKSLLAQGTQFSLPNIVVYTGSSAGIFPDPGDNSLLGRGNSDVIVKKNEVLLRSGKYNGELDTTLTPTSNINRSFIQLSHFDTKKEEGNTETIISTKEKSQEIKKMVIWTIINLENDQDSFTGQIALYDVINSQITTTTADRQTITKYNEGIDYKIINESLASFSGSSFVDTVNLINLYIYGVLKNKINLPGLPGYSPPLTYEITDQFPFLVTPNKITYLKGSKFNLTDLSVDTKEFANFSKFSNEISLNKQKGFFIVSGLNKDKPIFGPQKEIKTTEITPSKYTPTPTSYGVMGAQKLYLLSQDSIGPKGGINLNETLYGIPQDKFVGNENSIQNLTYSSVRGEELLSLIRIMFVFLRDHVHPIAFMSPCKQSEGSGVTIQTIEELLSNAENTILNQNIRIN
jgi:hypothetical protein